MWNDVAAAGIGLTGSGSAHGLGDRLGLGDLGDTGSGSGTWADLAPGSARRSTNGSTAGSGDDRLGPARPRPTGSGIDASPKRRGRGRGRRSAATPTAA